jgi:hypothetical protein
MLSQYFMGLKRSTVRYGTTSSPSETWTCQTMTKQRANTPTIKSEHFMVLFCRLNLELNLF